MKIDEIKSLEIKKRLNIKQHLLEETFKHTYRGFRQRDNWVDVCLAQARSDDWSVHPTINSAQYANEPVASRPLPLKPAFVQICLF